MVLYRVLRVSVRSMVFSWNWNLVAKSLTCLSSVVLRVSFSGM